MAEISKRSEAPTASNAERGGEDDETNEDLKRAYELLFKENARIRKVLDTAKAALDWYRNRFPDTVGACDAELDAQINGVLATSTQLLDPTVEQSINQLVKALVKSKSWMTGYADAVVRSAVDREPAAEQEPLTNEQIQQAANEAFAREELSWLGFEKDELGLYTVPSLSLCHYQLSHAVIAKFCEVNGIGTKAVQP